MRRLGPYELIRRLDAGPVAERWLAHRPGPGGALRGYVVTLIDPRVTAAPEHRNRLFDEVGRATLLSNSNIVSVTELVEHEGRAVLVTDWVEGVTLAELAARIRASNQRLAYVTVAYIVGEILRALVHAHELRHQGAPTGVVHGALTPGEVVLSTAGEVKLTGFGIARFAAELGGGVAATRYMPPEQLAGSREPSCDLFAVGGIVHELLDGHLFRVQALDDAQLHAAVRDGLSAPLSPQYHEYPVQLESVRAGLLAPRLDFRIPSARAGLQLLHQWPGYRNAALELEGLVRGCFEGQPTEQAREVIRESSATVIIDSSKLFDEQPAMPAQPPPPVEDFYEEDDEPIEPPPPLDEKDRESPWLMILLIAGIAVVGIGFIVFGIGFAVGWWGPNADDEVAEVEPEPEPEPKPEPVLPGAELTPEVDPLAKPVEVAEPEGPLPGAELTPEVEIKNGGGSGSGNSGSGASGSSGGSGTGSRARKGVSVTFKERHYETLQVKVDTRVFSFDGSKAVKLSPGAHILYLRERDDQPCLEAGKAYEITLLDPPLAMVKTL